jgi:hypothetical protein
MSMMRAIFSLARPIIATSDVRGQILTPSPQLVFRISSLEFFRVSGQTNLYVSINLPAADLGSEVCAGRAHRLGEPEVQGLQERETAVHRQKFQSAGYRSHLWLASKWPVMPIM